MIRYILILLIIAGCECNHDRLIKDYNVKCKNCEVELQYDSHDFNKKLELDSHP